jgi:xylan 1,4-beta-xylosidase
VRGNDKHHIQIGVARRDGQRVVFLRRVVDGVPVQPPTDEPAPDGPLTLVVSANPLGYQFSFEHASGGGLLGVVETKDLASETIGGFTGVYFGMYATGNGERSTAPADFDWFDYTITER